MTPPVTADNFFDQARKRQSLAKCSRLPLFDYRGGNPARRRFLPQIAKEPGQFFFTVVVDDRGSSFLQSGIHPHVERTVPEQTKTALGVFQLTRGNTEVENRPADLLDPHLLEHPIGVAKICLSQHNTVTELA